MIQSATVSNPESSQCHSRKTIHFSKAELFLKDPGGGLTSAFKHSYFGARAKTFSNVSFNRKPVCAYLSLRVIEVGWNSDHSILHRASQVALYNIWIWSKTNAHMCKTFKLSFDCLYNYTCSLFHLHKNKGSCLARGVHFAMSLNPSITIWCTHNFVGNILPVDGKKVIFLPS